MAIPGDPPSEPTSPKPSRSVKGRERSIKGLSRDEEDRLDLLSRSIEELRVDLKKRGKNGVEKKEVKGVDLEVPATSESDTEEEPEGLKELKALIKDGLKQPDTPAPSPPFKEDDPPKPSDTATPASLPQRPSPPPSQPPSQPPSGPPSRRHSSKTIDDKENLWMELLRRKDEQLTLVLKREKVAVEKMRNRIRDLETKLNGPKEPQEREEWAEHMKREQDSKLKDLQDEQARLIHDFNNVRDAATGHSGDPTLEMQMFVASNATEVKRGDADIAPTGDVTLVFTDVQSSTHLWDQATSDMMTSLQMHNALMRDLIAKHEGYEVKTEGDAFMVAFEEPENAVRWALDVQVKLLDEPWPDKILSFDDAKSVISPTGNKLWHGLRVRVGIHTGDPSCIPDILTGRMDYFGPMVNTGARVAGCARGGEVVCSAEVYNRLKPVKNTFKMNTVSLGEKKFKGVSTAVECYRLVPDSLHLRAFVEPKPQPATAAGGDQASKKTATFLQWVVREEQKRDEEPPTGTLALVFTDVQSSTHLWDTVEKEMWAALNKHNALMRRLISHHSGYEVKTEGDAFMVAFKDPKNAVLFVAEAQQRLVDIEWPAKLLANPAACEERDARGVVIWNGLRVRCGVHVGRPESARDPVTKRMDYFGPMVNLAARVGGCANGGEIVISKPVFDELNRYGTFQKNRLEVTPVGEKKFKGVTNTVHCYRVMPKLLAPRKFPPTTPPPSAALANAAAARVAETPPATPKMDPNSIVLPKAEFQLLYDTWQEFADMMDRLSENKARHFKDEKERKEVLNGRRMSQKAESPKPGKKPGGKDRRQSMFAQAAQPPAAARRKSVAAPAAPVVPPVAVAAAVAGEVSERKEVVGVEDCKFIVKEIENVTAFLASQPEKQVMKIFCQERDVKYVVAFGSTVEVVTVKRRPRRPSKEREGEFSPRPSGSTPPHTNATPRSNTSNTPRVLPDPALPLSTRPPLATPRRGSVASETEDDFPLRLPSTSPQTTPKTVPLRQMPSTSESWGPQHARGRAPQAPDPKYHLAQAGQAEQLHSPRPPNHPDARVSDLVHRSGSAATRRAQSLPHTTRRSSAGQKPIRSLLPSL